MERKIWGPLSSNVLEWVGGGNSCICSFLPPVVGYLSCGGLPQLLMEGMLEVFLGGTSFCLENNFQL